MEKICLRFSHVSEIILNNLGNESLARSKETSQGISKFHENERFFWIRIIKKYNEHFNGFEKSWSEVINRIPLDVLKQLAIAVQQFFKFQSFEKVAPLHIAVEDGYVFGHQN